ncbi:MAG: hypothetical protein JXA04_02120 [Gammaproteobacteria bacterium]|nr:hypothetical protein [Gammaproteobacteria bacterium]
MKKNVPVINSSVLLGEAQLDPVQAGQYPFLTKKNSFTIMLMINGTNVSVWSGRQDTDGNVSLSPVKQDSFKIVQHKTNAIVFAIDSSSDVFDTTGAGGWVETWNITLTKKGESSIYAYHVRSVNNYLIPPEINNEEQTGRFIYAFSGVIDKVDQIERMSE